MRRLLALAPADASAPAIVGPGPEVVTHDQLRQRMAGVDRALAQRGIEPSDRIAVIVPDAVPLAIAFLGIAARATCAPLDPSLPPEELRRALAQRSPKAVVVGAGVERGSLGVAEGLGVEVVALDDLLSDDDPASAPVLDPDHVALLLATSGTTGRPKLVPLTQRNLGASAVNVGRHLGLTPDDRGLLVMPLFHIHGLVAGLLAPLAAGGSVAVPAGRSPADLARSMSEHRPTWYSAAPTIHQAVVDGVARAADPSAAASLRLARSSSAALPRPLLERLETGLGVPIVETYGMTEAAHQIAANPLTLRKPGSVGIGAGPDVALLAGGAVTRSAGVPGEVVIRGENVFGGYADDPDATAAAFVDGWFRTGDEGVFDGDGYLSLTGRLSELINRGGEKVAPREVDDALLEHPAVHQAVTFAVPHPTLGEDVAAAVVLHEGADADLADIRAFVASRLTSVKVPRRLLAVQSLPTGPSGKLLRRGLAEAFGLDGPATAASFGVGRVRSADSTEAALVGLFEVVLGVDGVGRDDDFFDLGGDSLRALELIEMVREVFGVELPSELFVGADVTIASLAVAVSGLRTETPTARARIQRLQLGGTEPALVLVDAPLILVRHLLPLVGPDRPIVGLPVAMVEGAGGAQLERMARGLVRELRRERPHGPYVLSGHSIAGLLAYEVARQLELDGETVPYVLLLDTLAPDVRWLAPRLPLALHVRRAVALGARRGARYLRRLLRERRQGARPAPPGVDLDRVSASYRPNARSGRTGLVVTEQNVELAGDPALGWGPLTDRLDVETIEGDHRTILREPLVAGLADAMARLLGER